MLLFSKPSDRSKSENLPRWNRPGYFAYTELVVMMFKRTLYNELWIGQETRTADRARSEGLSHNRGGERFAVLNGRG